MNKIILLIGFLFLNGSIVCAQSGLIQKFNLIENDLLLTRPAQQNQYMDKIGQKAAILGSESGSFEFWIWPWKVLRNFDIQFFVGSTTQPILAKDILRDISVTPEATVLTFVYESFTVKEIMIVPYNQTAAIILLDVNTTTPLTIVPGFMPVMQPQWPAGIGGQYSYWDENVNAYVISESQKRGIFLCGSPVAQQMAAPPAHMFGDNPIQFKIDVKPNELNNNFIPIIISGSPLSTKYDSVKVQYKNILENVKNLYLANYNYYKSLRNNTVEIVTPNKKLNIAFEYGKVALKNLLVENPRLGKGLVAGYGLSGGGGRPGFAWYFGGDAFVNSLAISSFGDFSTVKDALLFTQKWQRQENFPIRKKNTDEKVIDVGKMAHELSQSEGLVDWWNDYHYGYNHADTTPWYLVTIGDYVRKTGDVDFARKSWNSIISAYNWCKSKDSNGDGLLDLKGAGLGVLEFGSLVKIFNDNYTQSLWTQAIKEVNNLAKLVGDSKIETETSNLFIIAKNNLDKIYWMEDLGYYSFGASEDGQKVKDKNIYASTPIVFGLFDSKKSESTICKFNESDIVTDWGVRNLSENSSLYDPANYNYGTIWGFTSFFISSAQFNTHFNLQGYQTIINTSNHMFDYGLGILPEVFSGEINTKLAEAYHNQGFSVSGFVFPMVQGLIGLEVDALTNVLSFAPKLPADWSFLKIKNIRVGSNKINVDYKINETQLVVNLNMGNEEKINFHFKPELPLGYKFISATVDGKVLHFTTSYSNQSEEIDLFCEVRNNSLIKVEYKPFVAIALPEHSSKIGSLNEEIKIISQELIGNRLCVNCEILAGKEYKLKLINGSLAKLANGAKIDGNDLIININSDKKKFIKHKVEIVVN